MELKFMRRKEAEPVDNRPVISIVKPSADRGLTSEEVRERFDAGYDNCDIAPPTKTIKDIILSNVLLISTWCFSSLPCVLFLLAHGITSPLWV